MHITSYGLSRGGKKIIEGFGKTTPSTQRGMQSKGQKKQPSLPSSTTYPSSNTPSSSNKNPSSGTIPRAQRHIFTEEEEEEELTYEEKPEKLSTLEIIKLEENLGKIVNSIKTNEEKDFGTIVVHNSPQLAQYLENLTKEPGTIETEPKSNTWVVQSSSGKKIFKFQRI